MPSAALEVLPLQPNCWINVPSVENRQWLHFGTISAPGNLFLLLFYMESFQLQTTDLPPWNRLWNQGGKVKCVEFPRVIHLFPSRRWISLLQGFRHHRFSLDIPDVSQITPWLLTWKCSPLCLNWADWEAAGSDPGINPFLVCKDHSGPRDYYLFNKMHGINYILMH